MTKQAVFWSHVVAPKLGRGGESTREEPGARPGFAMLTVLWVMTVASIVALAGALVGRNGVNAARNRFQMERAFWIAMGCARRAQATIDESLLSARSIEDAAFQWRTLDRQVLQSPVVANGLCEYSLEAAGTRLDINAASDEMIVRLLRALGHGDEALEMTDALGDWRDVDDIPRPLGAERDWYVSAGRMPPRNDRLANLRELARVRGFEEISAYDSVFTTEHGRISLATAPVTVLIAVPGFSRETAERIVELRDAGAPLRDLIQLPALLSDASRDELLANYSQIARITTADPDAWILTAQARSGFPPSAVAIEWRLLRTGRRVTVTQMRVLE